MEVIKTKRCVNFSIFKGLKAAPFMEVIKTYITVCIQLLWVFEGSTVYGGD